MCFYPHFPNFSTNLRAIRNRKCAHNGCWVVSFFCENRCSENCAQIRYRKCIGDYKIRDIGSSAGHNLLVGANNFLSIFFKIYSLFWAKICVKYLQQTLLSIWGFHENWCMEGRILRNGLYESIFRRVTSTRTTFCKRRTKTKSVYNFRENISCGYS